ncbi:MAG: Fimbrial assembly protein (PilN) [Syntrophorhabdus sp. PtaU1.Bin153]|nr:MAG: Fimbrial assembly protein (PilN) [Syntrophorhabdus sp. PtaU1.Bin153]
MMPKIPIQQLQQKLDRAKAKIITLWNPAWKVLTYSLVDGVITPLRALSVSIEKSGISVAYGSRFLSKIRIGRACHYTGEPGKYFTPESFATTVVLALEELKAPRVEVILSIPREWVVIRTVELPVTVKENLATVISYELDRLTPLSAPEALYDFKVIGESNEKLVIVVWAARASQVNPYIDALKKQGIAVKKVTVDLSTLGAVSHYMTDSGSPILLALKDGGYEGGLVIDGSVTSVVGGSFDDTTHRRRMEQLREAIDPLLDRMAGTGSSPRIVMFCRNGSRNAGEWDLGAPVLVVDDGEIEKRFGGDRTELSPVALGGLLQELWEKAPGTDLLSKGLRTARQKSFALTIFLLVVLVAFAAVFAAAPLKRQTMKLEEIDRQINMRKGEVKKIEALKKEIDAIGSEVSTIKGFKEGRPSSIVLMKELTTILPKTVWLTRTRITGTTIDIEGYAAGSATEMISKLETSPYFQKVEFASPTIRDARQNKDRFVIRLEIEGVRKSESKVEGEGLKNGKKK